jgi:iron complex transport system substrate-binding protein
MRVYALIFSALLYGSAAAQDLSPADSKAETRIVSTSLCGDTYVLDMLPHDQIAALSWQADDALSLAPDDLREKPKAWDDLERLLALKPTHVVFGPGEGMRAEKLLAERGIKSVQINWGDNYDSVYENRKRLADTFGLRLHYQLPPTPITINAPDVLYLSRAGGTAGPGTYVDAAIESAGGINMIKIKGWHTPDPETLAGLHPDLIITSFFEQGYESVNAQGARHALIQDKLNKTPRVNVPGALWPCAGPGLEQATDIISNAIEGLSQ